MKLEFALYMLLVLMLTGAAGAQRPPICDGSETPCDEARPWHRGTIEKSCARPEAIETLRELNPEKTILSCDCAHTCDETNAHTGETDRRAWDPFCQARCSPGNCACEHEHPCDL